jgi:protein arginine N-methyltransferase 5
MFTAEVIDNSRFKSLEYHVENTAVLHGFAGYFDTQLYKDVYLSMYPQICCSAFS